MKAKDSRCLVGYGGIALAASLVCMFCGFCVEDESVRTLCLVAAIFVLSATLVLCGFGLGKVLSPRTRIGHNESAAG